MKDAYLDLQLLFNNFTLINLQPEIFFLLNGSLKITQI